MIREYLAPGQYAYRAERSEMKTRCTACNGSGYIFAQSDLYDGAQRLATINRLCNLAPDDDGAPVNSPIDLPPVDDRWCETCWTDSHDECDGENETPSDAPYECQFTFGDECNDVNCVEHNIFARYEAEDAARMVAAPEASF